MVLLKNLSELGGAADTPHPLGPRTRGRLPKLLVLDPVGPLKGDLSQFPVDARLARLLVDVVGVARHRRHGDLLRVVNDNLTVTVRFRGPGLCV